MRTGLLAEMRAAVFLDGLGWRLLERGFRGGGGELDLVALDGETLVFVEVKFRREGLPERAVDFNKRLRLLRAAGAYLRRRRARPEAVRFDIAAVSPAGVRLIRGAFAPGGWVLPVTPAPWWRRLARRLISV